MVAEPLRRSRKSMKKRETLRVPANFGPETRFEVRTSPAGLARREEEQKLEALKRRMFEETLAETWEPEARRFLSIAANEAAATAWLSGYPLLVFPALFEEKLAEADYQMERQFEIRERSRELLAV
jgi:hypothetical protein